MEQLKGLNDVSTNTLNMNCAVCVSNQYLFARLIPKPRSLLSAFDGYAAEATYQSMAFYRNYGSPLLGDEFNFLWSS